MGFEAKGFAHDRQHQESRTMEEPEFRPPKRAKVALACQRCKIRKQKCDGIQPACSSCAKLAINCEYIASLVPHNGQKKVYIKALERRVAELESSLAAYGESSVGADHWKPASLRNVPRKQTSHSEVRQEDESDDEDDPLIRAVRDLSLSASGHYVGGTSTLTIGRILSSVVNSQNSHSLKLSSYNPLVEHSPRSYAPKQVELRGQAFLSPAVADRLLEGFMKHIATRFPVLHTPYLRHLHSSRDQLQNVYEQSILNLVYATGGRWIESTGETGYFFSDQHYEAAVEHMDAILEMRGSHSLNYLLLMAVYCLRAPRDPGAWTYTGLAIRLCIELGLHRRKKHRVLTMEAELDKRRFWTCYFLDRDISIALGRPPAISDHDIDVELPLDIAEETEDPQIVIQAGHSVKDIPRNPPTTMTMIVHRIRLKKIESQIQHIIYRVDRPTKISNQIIQRFLRQLQRWKDVMPAEALDYKDNQGQPFDGVDVYMVAYYRCVRLLLYPQLTESPVNLDYLKICAEACGGVCKAYKRLHHQFSIGYSSLSVQSVFLAGLTLIYCAWLVPPNTLDVTAPLTDCSIILYVMTERWPSARKYRDIFEQIKSAVMDLIAQGRHQPRKAVDMLDADMRKNFASIDSDSHGGIGEDFTQMISEMTGQNMDSGRNLQAQHADFGTAQESFITPIQMSQFSQYHDFSTNSEISMTSVDGWGAIMDFDLVPDYIDAEDEVQY